MIFYSNDCRSSVLIYSSLMYDQVERARILRSSANSPVWYTGFNCQCGYCGAFNDEVKKTSCFARHFTRFTCNYFRNCFCSPGSVHLFQIENGKRASLCYSAFTSFSQSTPLPAPLLTGVQTVFSDPGLYAS